MLFEVDVIGRSVMCELKNFFMTHSSWFIRPLFRKIICALATLGKDNASFSIGDWSVSNARRLDLAQALIILLEDKRVRSFQMVDYDMYIGCMTGQTDWGVFDAKYWATWKFCRNAWENGEEHALFVCLTTTFPFHPNQRLMQCRTSHGSFSLNK